MVVVLCTEYLVCGLASHTSLSDSHVAHPSFFSFQVRLTDMSDCYRIGAFGHLLFFFFKLAVLMLLLVFSRIILFRFMVIYWIYGVWR